MAGRKYLYTERAHYMCPNMHFGILADIGADLEANRIIESIGILKAAHPLMRSLIAEEKGSSKVFYEEHPTLEIPVMINEIGDEWQADYDAVSKAGWNVQKEALLKIFAYPIENGTRVLFITHHLLCDGRGLLQLVQEFADHYTNSVEPHYVDEKLMDSLEDLPSGSDLPFISKVIVKDANRRWSKERHNVSYDEYLKFERDFDARQDIKRIVKNIDEEALTELYDSCKENKISLNDYLIAKMMIEENIGKVVIASDIRSKITNYNQGALGNYATAFGVEIKKRPEEIMDLAQKVSAKVKGIISTPQKEMLVLACYFNMEPELLDAVAISTLGDFESNSGRFVGSRMFGYEKRDGHCITNLGKIESSNIREATFIPPASPANKKAWGVLTVNGNMRICSIDQDHV